MSNSLRSHGLQYARFPCPSTFPRVCSDTYPLSQWCYPIISSSVTLFSSCRQPFLASGKVPMSRLFTLGGQSYLSFSISLSSEYSGLISFRIDWFDVLDFLQTWIFLPFFLSVEMSRFILGRVLIWLLRLFWVEWGLISKERKEERIFMFSYCVFLYTIIHNSGLKLAGWKVITIIISRFTGCFHWGLGSGFISFSLYSF